MTFVLTIINVNNIVRTKIIGHYPLLVSHYSLLGIQTPVSRQQSRAKIFETCYDTSPRCLLNKMSLLKMKKTFRTSKVSLFLLVNYCRWLRKLERLTFSTFMNFVYNIAFVNSER